MVNYKFLIVNVLSFRTSCEKSLLHFIKEAQISRRYTFLEMTTLVDCHFKFLARNLFFRFLTASSE